MEREWVGLLVLLAVGAVLALIEGIREVVWRKNPFGIARRYNGLGIFVWGDAIVLGLFWLGVVMVSAILRDKQLLMLIISVFWSVRSMGEVQYWMHEQFSTKVRNKPSDLWGSQWFSGDSIWFVYQLFWQCMSVLFIVWTIYLITGLVTGI